MKRLLCLLLGHPSYARHVEGFKCTAVKFCVRCDRRQPVTEEDR